MWPGDGLNGSKPSQPQPIMEDAGNEVHDLKLRRAIEELGEDMRMLAHRMLEEADLNIARAIFRYANPLGDTQPSQDSPNTDHQLSARLDLVQEQISSMTSQQQVMLQQMYAVQDTFSSEQIQIIRQSHQEVTTEVQSLLLQQSVTLGSLVHLNGNLLALMQNSERPPESAASNNNVDEVEPEIDLSVCQSVELEADALRFMDVKRSKDSFNSLHRETNHLHRQNHVAHHVDQCIGKMASMCEWFMKLREPPRQGFLAHFVNGPLFNSACTVTIILNAVTVALYSDLDVETAIATGLPKVDSSRKFVEASFVAFYTLEAALKVHVHKLYYFVGKDMGWNIFDLLLIIMGIIDFASEQMKLTQGSVNPTFMRLIRMCKLVRILRSIRVLKFFHELRVMLLALLSSTMSLAWSMVVLVFILHMFGLVFIQGVTVSILDTLGGRYHQLNFEVAKRFGSLSKGMLTLYQAVTGGEDWAPIYEATKHIGQFYAWLFLFFTIFFMFAVANIVTAIYVSSVQKNCTPDHQEILEDWRRTHKIQKKTITQLIEELDADHSGKINKTEFRELANSETLTALLETLGIQVADAEILFHLLTSFDDQADLEVDRNMFLNALLRIKGQASAIDLQVLSFQLKLVHQGQSKLKEQVRQIQNSLRKPHRHTVDISHRR